MTDKITQYVKANPGKLENKIRGAADEAIRAGNISEATDFYLPLLKKIELSGYKSGDYSDFSKQELAALVILILK